MGTTQHTIKDIIFTWQLAMMRLNFEVKPAEHFLEIQVQNTNPYTAIAEEIDWWPVQSIKQRKQTLEMYGNRAPAYWTVYKGTRQTADHLWETKDSYDKWAAIFIQAFIKDRIDYLPEHWRGKGYSLLNELRHLSYKEDLNFGWYHSCRNQLPVSLMNLYEIKQTLKPTNINMLIELAAVDTVLCLSSWQLIRIVGINKAT